MLNENFFVTLMKSEELEENWKLLLSRWGVKEVHYGICASRECKIIYVTSDFCF